MKRILIVAALALWSGYRLQAQTVLPGKQDIDKKKQYLNNKVKPLY